MAETTSCCGNELKSKKETEFEKTEKINKSGEIKLSIYERQNSVNETRENCDFSPRTSPGRVVYSRQPSQRPLFEEMANNNSTTVDISAINSNDSIYSVDKENGGNRRNSCCCLVQAFSFITSILTLGLVLFLFYKTDYNSDFQELPEVIIEQSNQVLENDDGISGSFKLNQHYLYDHKEIRWMADEHSTIVPSRDEPCLAVPEDGKYQIFSRFTFRIPAGYEKELLTHNLILKTRTESGDIKETFKRQYVSVIEHRLNQESELRKPSVFIQFFDMQAGDKVCTGVSNPDILYVSSIDNDVNIIKV